MGGVTVHGGGRRGGRGAGSRALRAGGHHGDAGEAGAGAAVQGPAVGAVGGPRLAAAGDDVPVLELPAALLGCQLELHEHHMVAHTQRQGERGAARQEVIDLGREGAPSGHGTARGTEPPPSNSTSPCSGATALRSHGCSAGSRGVTPSSPWPHRAGGEQPRPRTTPAQCQLHQLTAPSLLPPPPPSSPSTKLPRCARPPRHRTHSTRRQGRAGADTAV